MKVRGRQMRCKNCGNEIKVDSLYCNVCGEKNEELANAILKADEIVKKNGMKALIFSILSFAIPLFIVISGSIMNEFFGTFQSVPIPALIMMVCSLGFGIAATVIGGTYSIFLFFNVIDLL